MSSGGGWIVKNPDGKWRILVTRMLPGEEWLDILSEAGYRIEIRVAADRVSASEMAGRIGKNCQGVIGQLTERWDAGLFDLLSAAGGRVYCNYAVGFDNVDIDAATRNNIAVGNTPGVLTETTAEMAVSLTMACSRRIVEADTYTRTGQFDGWLPALLLGKRLWRGTLGVIGTGRIGSVYTLMMVRAFLMDLVYFDVRRNLKLESELLSFSSCLSDSEEKPVGVRYSESVEEVLQAADVVSLHVPLNAGTRYLITGSRLNLMKPDAVLINTSRGAVINESELVEHCKLHPEFRVGLDVFENEPFLAEGLAGLKNVVIAPHIASATGWTRENMARLAALNVRGVMEGYPVWEGGSVGPFLEHDPPMAIPSVVNRTVIDQHF